MVFRLNGRQRNCLFIVILGLTLILVTSALITGHRQDQAFRANYQRYQEAVALMGEQEYDLALQSFRDLDADTKASYKVLYMTAYCEYQTGDNSTAARHMQMAREDRPALIQDPQYLQRYGAILFELGQYEEAALYLKESLKYTSDPATVEAAEEYLAQLDQEQVGGR